MLYTISSNIKILEKVLKSVFIKSWEFDILCKAANNSLPPDKCPVNLAFRLVNA